ncbi:MAG: hypothetical protein V1871_05965 [Planctomycetota bacterium]
MKKILLMSIMVLAIFIDVYGAGNPAQDLQIGIQKKDGSMIKNAVDALVSRNDDKSYNELISELESLKASSEPEAYWIIVSGIARFTNKDVIAKITTFILSNKGKAISRDLLKALKGNPSSNIVFLLSTILEKSTHEMQKEAIYQLGSIPTKESLEALFNFLRPFKDNDTKDTIKGPLIKEVIYFIKNITNLDRGTYPESWIQWWNENKNKDIGQLIQPKEVGHIGSVADYRDMRDVRTLDKEKVIVVRNDKCDKTNAWDMNYDHIQDILTRMGIEHTVVGKSELDKESYSLDDKWMIVFNCNYFYDHCCAPGHKPSADKKSATTVRSQECAGDGKTAHQIHNSKLSDKTIQKIKNFVETGGYLFTEDLNIQEIIVRAFPGTIMNTKSLPEQEVKILPAPGAAVHPYLKCVFELPPSNIPQASSEGKSSETTSVKEQDFRIDAIWKIDSESPDIKIIKKDVTVLIVSPDLAKANKNEGAVAVTWGYSAEKLVTTDGGTGPSYAGGGRILHVMSHFGHQKSKIDEFALQNLILNFFMELNERRPKASTAKK